MDWVGVILNAAVYVFFVTAFTFGGAQWAWGSGGVITFIALFVVTLAIYAVQQRFSLFTTPENRLFPVDFLKSRSMWLLHISTACASTTFFIPLYYLPLYYQFVHGENGTESAVRLLPLICVCVFSFIINGALLPVFGYYMPWYVVAAVFQLSAGAVMYSCVDLNTSNATIYGFSVLLALGGGLASQSSYSIASSKVEISRTADAVGFINVAQVGGVMIALTVTSSVFQNVGYSKLQYALGGLEYSSQEIRATLGGEKSSILASASPDVKNLALNAIVETIGTEYIVIIAAGALALVTSLLMKREKLNLAIQAVG